MDKITIAVQILAEVIGSGEIDLYSSEDQRENTCKWALKWAETIIKVDNTK